jgi:hypothetical protein
MSTNPVTSNGSNNTQTASRAYVEYSDHRTIVPGDLAMLMETPRAWAKTQESPPALRRSGLVHFL